MILPSMSDHAGPVLEAVLEAERQSDDLFSNGSLASVVTALVNVARHHDVKAVFGASHAGDRLVGAMVLNDVGLRPWRPGDRSVLVVDAVVVTDLGLRTRAAEAQALGAVDTHAAVVRLIGTTDSGRDIAPLSSLTTIDA